MSEAPPSASDAPASAELYEILQRLADERARALDAERAAHTEIAERFRTRQRELHEVAHSLRGSLSAILGWAEILSTTAPAGTTQRDGCDAIARNARAMSELISRTLGGDRGGDRAGAPSPSSDLRPEVPAVMPSTGAMPEALAGARILVVDDDANARELVGRILVEASAEVITAASADEALALLPVVRPSVIVSDIGMSSRDGYQLIRAIRGMAGDALGATPALALTGYAEASDHVRALLAGFQHHIAKPVEPRDLIAAVCRLRAMGLRQGGG